jgi:hypothetical protein
VAYEDWGNSGNATVMKFNGTSWVNVGNAGFSTGIAHYTCLSFSSSDSLPYIAYEDFNNDRKATVMEFNGTNWVYVGPADFSAGATYNEDLAISSKGEPYVVYSDNLGMLTVMRYDSVSVGINELQQSKFSIYPNPATNKITIEIAEGQAPSQLSIINLNGEEVLTRSLIKPKTQIDITNLPSGVYFVRLTNDNAVEVGKFVKQ